MTQPLTREQMRSQIAAACRRLILSQQMVELCETEATPNKKRFWLIAWSRKSSIAIAIVGLSN